MQTKIVKLTNIWCKFYTDCYSFIDFNKTEELSLERIKYARSSKL